MHASVRRKCGISHTHEPLPVVEMRYSYVAQLETVSRPAEEVQLMSLLLLLLTRKLPLLLGELRVKLLQVLATHLLQHQLAQPPPPA